MKLFQMVIILSCVLLFAGCNQQQEKSIGDTDNDKKFTQVKSSKPNEKKKTNEYRNR